MLAAALAVAANVAFAPVQVREWPSSGGFDVVQADSSCVMAATYEFDGRAPVEFALIYDGDRAFLALTSMDWSNREGGAYPMIYLLGDKVWTGDATGIVEGYVKKGFVAGFEAGLLDDVAMADALFVTTGQGDTVVTHISLSGSAAGVATLRRCAGHVQRQNAERDRRERRWDYIAPDPFAAPAAPPSDLPDHTDTVTWASPPRPEFPDRALSRGVGEGTVSLSCTVQPNGSATACSILSETPAGVGFGQAALRSLSRARFGPQTVAAVAAGARATFAIRFSAATE